MYRTLTDTRHTELHRAEVLEKVGPELAKDLYSDEAAMDHIVVGDPNADKNPRVVVSKRIPTMRTTKTRWMTMMYLKASREIQWRARASVSGEAPRT